MTSSLDKLNALSALAGLSRKATEDREAAQKTPVNKASNPSTDATLALAALAAMLGAAVTGNAQQTTPVQDSVDIFDVNDITSLEVVIVINGNNHVVFSI